MIHIEALNKTYRLGDVRVEALKDVNLVVREGEFVSIIGPSGSGKSTLMNIIGCLDVPTSGRYWLKEREVSRLTDNQLAEIRNREVGFVFQTFNLLPRLNALDNVMRPLVYRGMGKKERLSRALQALEQVGLQDRVHHRPNQLSGGQQQRVAIARALVGNPALILADEPTGNLDTTSGQEIMALLKGLHGRGKTLVLITHNPEASEEAQRQIKIQDGRVRELGGGQ